ncbi:MAG: CRISPR-associated endonuclease Cas2 [Armatimonadetes bacterium]|nr:CRISPR-associated endonuclease Cas2 [Candidatus Hippobium faecium]
MRLCVIFDLPVVAKNDLKNYQQFRRFLLNDGYDMVQFSVYARMCIGRDDIEKHMERLILNLPPKGSVRTLEITEKQFAAAKILVGKKKPKENKKVTGQLTLLDDMYEDIFGEDTEE